MKRKTLNIKMYGINLSYDQKKMQSAKYFYCFKKEKIKANEIFVQFKKMEK